MRKSFGRIAIGVLLILFGVVHLLNNFGYDIQLNFDGWWTIFIIFPSLTSMVDDGVRPGNLIALLIGVVLLANAQNWIPVQLEPFFDWPIFLVIGGLALLFGGNFRSSGQYEEGDRDAYRNTSDSYYQETSSNANTDTQSDRYTKTRGNQDPNDDAQFPEYFALFGGSEMRNASKHLRGANVTAIFGGIEADFSQATIQENITIHVTSVFGGNEIYLPPNVRVRVHGIPIFGGVSNGHRIPQDENAPLVTIEAFSMFGGTDIK